MINRRKMILFGTAAGTVALAARGWRHANAAQSQPPQNYSVTHSDAEWRKLLSPAQYDILREQGTEPPFTSPLLKQEAAGTFACAGCALPGFSSKTKYDSGTGWPSFWAPLPNAVLTSNDTSFSMDRTEVHCARCGSHLGHVFADGPQPTGMRYCMNGLALEFTPA